MLNTSFGEPSLSPINRIDILKEQLYLQDDKLILKGEKEGTITYFKVNNKKVGLWNEIELNFGKEQTSKLLSKDFKVTNIIKEDEYSIHILESIDEENKIIIYVSETYVEINLYEEYNLSFLTSIKRTLGGIDKIKLNIFETLLGVNKKVSGSNNLFSYSIDDDTKLYFEDKELLLKTILVEVNNKGTIENVYLVYNTMLISYNDKLNKHSFAYNFFNSYWELLVIDDNDNMFKKPIIELGSTLLTELFIVPPNFYKPTKVTIKGYIGDNLYKTATVLL